MATMTLFTFPGFETLAEPLDPYLQQREFQIRRFANGEIFVTIATPFDLSHCILLGSITPPDENLLSLALLAHTLKKDGCKRITALIPYLAYSRQDKQKAGESLATAWTGSILHASGVDTVITIDVHSEHDQALYPMPLMSVSPAGVFAEAARKFGLADATVVAPDHGALQRCRALNNALGRAGVEVPYLSKRRDPSGVKHLEFCGQAAPRVLILDDILDTGATLTSACEMILRNGAKEIVVMVTHGLFTGSDWARLWSLGVSRIFCADTVPLPGSILEDPRITVLPVGSLLREGL